MHSLFFSSLFSFDFHFFLCSYYLFSYIFHVSLFPPFSPPSVSFPFSYFFVSISFSFPLLITLLSLIFSPPHNAFSHFLSSHFPFSPSFLFSLLPFRSSPIFPLSLDQISFSSSPALFPKSFPLYTPFHSLSEIFSHLSINLILTLASPSPLHLQPSTLFTFSPTLKSFHIPLTLFLPLTFSISRSPYDLPRFTSCLQHLLSF